MKSRLAIGLVAGSIAWTMVAAQAAPTAAYVGSGVQVVRAGGQAVLDNGGVICRATGPSVGGGCVDFGAPGAKVGVKVTDANLGTNVAFQVCIDNNGDGICGGPNGLGSLRCGDDIFFSHSDDGAFFNPLGPLPTGFRPECPAGNPSIQWRGYVVLLCSGVHSGSVGNPHQHGATQGAISTTDSGTGYGDFCGAGGSAGQQNPTVAKAYILE